jgi:SMC interacting uncharacterized protein involved in chromosome segregation
MADTVDNLTKTEVKLLIDNSLLEQEKRLSKEFRDELDTQTTKLIAAVEKQNLLYSDQIIQLTKDITTLNGVVDNLKARISNIRAQMLIVGTACTTLGGFAGFLIAQLAK